VESVLAMGRKEADLHCAGTTDIDSERLMKAAKNGAPCMFTWNKSASINHWIADSNFPLAADVEMSHDFLDCPDLVACAQPGYHYSEYARYDQVQVLTIRESRVVSTCIIVIPAIDHADVTALILLDLSAAFDMNPCTQLDVLQRPIALEGTSLVWFNWYITYRSQSISGDRVQY